MGDALARAPALASAVKEIFLASVFAWQRKQARALGLRHVGVGAVAFSQRAGDSLNLNPCIATALRPGLRLETRRWAARMARECKPRAWS